MEVEMERCENDCNTNIYIYTYIYIYMCRLIYLSKLSLRKSSRRDLRFRVVNVAICERILLQDFLRVSPKPKILPLEQYRGTTGFP